MKIDKQTKVLIEDLQQMITRAAQIVAERHESVTGQLENIMTPLTGAVEEYNALVNEWNEALQSIADDIEVTINDKSDAWQESERGQAFVAWKVDITDKMIYEVRPPALELPELPEVNEPYLPGFDVSDYV